MKLDEIKRFEAKYPKGSLTGKTSSYEEKLKALKHDPVENPLHYNRKGIECIHAIEASMGEEEFKGYLKGNAIKYLWRYKYKDNATEDLGKCIWYASRLKEITHE